MLLCYKGRTSIEKAKGMWFRVFEEWWGRSLLPFLFEQKRAYLYLDERFRSIGNKGLNRHRRGHFKQRREDFRRKQTQWKENESTTEKRKRMLECSITLLYYQSIALLAKLFSTFLTIKEEMYSVNRYWIGACIIQNSLIYQQTDSLIKLYNRHCLQQHHSVILMMVQIHLSDDQPIVCCWSLSKSSRISVSQLIMQRSN